MNRSQKAILIAVIAIVLGLILLAVSFFVLGGAARLAERGWEYFIQRGAEPAVTEDISPDAIDDAIDKEISRELAPGDRLQLAEFSELELNGLVCDVDICTALGPEFSISLEGLDYDPAMKGQYLLIYRGKDNERYSLTEKDGKLTITGKGVDGKLSVSKLRDLILNNSRRLVLLVPEDWKGRVSVNAAAGDVDLTGVKVSAADITLSAGDLDLTDVEAAGDLVLRLSAGDLDLTDVACGELDVNVDLGDVDLTDVACGDLYLNVNAGDPDFTNVACGTLDISMNAGELDLNDVACGDLKIKVDAGSVGFNSLLPESADIYCRLGSVDGTLKGSPADYTTECGVSMGEYHVAGSGAGPRLIRISVDMGNIDLDFD